MWVPCSEATSSFGSQTSKKSQVAEIDVDSKNTGRFPPLSAKHANFTMHQHADLPSQHAKDWGAQPETRPPRILKGEGDGQEFCPGQDCHGGPHEEISSRYFLLITWSYIWQAKNVLVGPQRWWSWTMISGSTKNFAGVPNWPPRTRPARIPMILDRLESFSKSYSGAQINIPKQNRLIILSSYSFPKDAHATENFDENWKATTQALRKFQRRFCNRLGISSAALSAAACTAFGSDPNCWLSREPF